MLFFIFASCSSDKGDIVFKLLPMSKEQYINEYLFWEKGIPEEEYRFYNASNIIGLRVIFNNEVDTIIGGKKDIIDFISDNLKISSDSSYKLLKKVLTNSIIIELKSSLPERYFEHDILYLPRIIIVNCNKKFIYDKIEVDSKTWNDVIVINNTNPCFIYQLYEKNIGIIASDISGDIFIPKKFIKIVE